MILRRCEGEVLFKSRTSARLQQLISFLAELQFFKAGYCSAGAPLFRARGSVELFLNCTDTVGNRPAQEPFGDLGWGIKIRKT